MRRIIKGVASALLLILLLVGLPVLLVHVWSVGLPHVQFTPAGLWAALLRPDDGTLFLTALKVIAWIVWVILLVSVVTELVAGLRRIRPRPLPGLALPQGIARGLVAATLALFINTNSAIGQPAAVPAAHAAPLSPAPAGAARVPVEKHAESGTAHFDRYTVKKGDTLSEIALDHLGNGHRYPEIFKASRGIRQPRGYRLTDPNVIDIGWTLHIPTDHKRSDKPAKRVDKKRDEPHTSDDAPTTTNTPTPATPMAPSSPTQNTEAAPSTAPASADAETVEDNSPPAWLLTGLAGAGAVLAGSLWLVLLRRRAVQHHHRRPGYTITPPPAATIPVEKTLRHQGRPVTDLLTAVDDNLRRLAATLLDAGKPLPTLLAVAASPTRLQLHLAEDLTLPEPWQPADDDESVWTLTLADLPDDLEPLEPDGPAPWPHLATVGADDTGHWWLINLEAAGITAIDGDPDYAADLARYLAAELATSPWSRDVQVDLVGAFEELSGLDAQRLRFHTDPSGIDDTIAAAVDTIDRLNHLNHEDLAAARAGQAGDEIWLNRVLVTQDTEGHFSTLATLITNHPRQTSTAALFIGSVQAITPTLDITVGMDGRVHIPAFGLHLIANGITSDEARGCVQLLQAAEQLNNAEVPSDQGASWHQYVDRAGRLRPTHTEPRHPDGSGDPKATNLPQADEDIVEGAATTSEDLAVLAPTVSDTTTHAVAEADPTLDQDLSDWFSSGCVRPRLSVLGPMRVRVGPGGQPHEAQKRKPYYTELVAYLASRQNGATSTQLCSAFATTPARIHRDLAVVRKWLGADPTTHHRYLPDAIRESAKPDAHGLYQLHDVLVDADLFRRLRLRGQTRGEDGLNDYMQALSLVTGSPYSELRPGGGIWLADDRDDQHLLVATVDTAHLAVTMALQIPSLEKARLAAETAAHAAPDEDIPKLDLAAVVATEGDEDRQRRLVNDIHQQRDTDGPVQLPSRTGQLAELARRSNQARASSA